jgi:sugar/nucleoside kinase (ribokinase family)
MPRRQRQSEGTLNDPHVNVVVVGSIGIDTIETPTARREDILGGSASYACIAGSYAATMGIVGVVGTDFPTACTDLYARFAINQDGLQVAEGKTFRWSGVYEENMNNRRTLRTDLNVLADFTPDLPDHYRTAPYVLLGNNSPALQRDVLDQIADPRFVMADTMDLWIDTARDDLLEVIRRVDMLTLNDSEARHLTGKHSLPAAAVDLLKHGPSRVLIKKGEHGSMLFSGQGRFLMPAYPINDVVDPTGAGDSFAGGFMGYLASRDGAALTEMDYRLATIYGSAIASFTVEAFSTERLQGLSREEIDTRLAAFQTLTEFRV